MSTAKSLWQTWVKLLIIPAVTMALLLVLFTGLKGNAALSSEFVPRGTFSDHMVNLPAPAPMQIVTSAAISDCETDIVLILDRSGSMQEDTICFGCYEPGGSIYPGGERWGLAWPNNGTLEPWPNGPPPPCDPAEPIESGGHLSLVMEAEFYDWTNRPYHRKYNLVGDTYWALQRPGGDTGNCNGNPSCGSSSLDGRGAYMMHMPHSSTSDTYEFNEVDGNTPRLEYRIEIPAAYHNNAFYVFVRGQGGGQWPHQTDARRLYWGVDASRGPAIGQTNTGNFSEGGYNEPVIGPNNWQWGRLTGSVNLSQGVHTLHLWAGGIGFRLDKIILTTNYYFNPSGVGPDETHGRDWSGLACNACNPNYGLLVEGQCDNRHDDLYDDDQPIRFLKEAAKDFTARLDPAVDQIGLVTYGTVGSDFKASIDIYLQCVEEHGAPCYFDDVLNAIEAMNADGDTNIPDGIRRGIEVFAHDNSRGAAAHIMILMTNGQTNQTDGLPSTCYADEGLWDPPNNGSEQDDSRDCVVYYAHQAREAGYVIYTISLGLQADIDLLQYVADETGGLHYTLSDAEDLNAVFDDIFRELSYSCFGLGINKTVTPPVGVGGGPFTYTIALSSTGMLSPTGVFIQDRLPADTRFVTASGSFSPAHPLAGDTLTWDIGTLGYDGSPVSVTLVLSAALPLATFTNTATVLCDQGISVTATAVASQAQPILNVAKNVWPAIVTGGQPFTYTIAVSNSGAAEALLVRLYDTLPSGTFFVTASGVFSPAHPLGGETVGWQVGTLPNDGIPFTATLVLTTTASLETIPLTNTATVTCAQGFDVFDSATLMVTPWFLYLPTVLKDKVSEIPWPPR